MMEYHRHIFGENKQAAMAVVQPLPAAFDSEKRLDYDVRTDDNPVYVAFAETPFTATTDTWIVQKFTYDASDRPTRIQVAKGAWDDRASLFS
jgi:YD repeat-containing protein